MDFSNLDGRTLLVTGGTGSFGNVFVENAIKNKNIAKIIIYSRDEMKQWHMSKKFQDSRLRFFIGDIRDKPRLTRSFEGVDYVIHAAATKIVPTAEYNPFECIKTNINGAMNVIDAALDSGVKKVVALSTDKASSPINLYGATKLISDKVFVAANAYSGKKGCKFSVVRYGNVMGSRGSVIPFFNNFDKDKPLPITHPEMTRFMISLEDGIDLVLKAFEVSFGGEIFVKKIPSMKILEVADAIRPSGEIDIVGIREGEKLHEQMISVEDAAYTFDYDDHYRILPIIHEWYLDKRRIQGGKKVPENFSYTSKNNTNWMSKDFLQAWIIKNKDRLGKI